MKKMVVILSCLVLFNCASVNNEGVGTVAGGVVGGLLGSQFGHGSGRVLAATGGAIAGAFLGGNIGKNMDKVDRMQMQKALETTPNGQVVSWVNPNTNNQYQTRVVKTYYVERNGSNYQAPYRQPCRQYNTRVIIDGRVERMTGTACRQPNGVWRSSN